ncbi:alpha/beta hydrolase [Subtercola endophyticus]|uniref:alpha/beta hydrolase n=1 Tax=Subtercola endophyticus TaxID=2895559 RepID=UPI001E60678F|nr:alpha/beta hydrolase [Subtercola endophyticus]UFS57476.1 alpha/beta hydrolase [Subtercola endophyticus]
MSQQSVAVSPRVTRGDTVMFWAVRVVATLAVVVTVWAAVSTGAMLVHGHPAYVVLLAVTLVVAVLVAVRAWLRRRPVHRRHKVITGILLVLSLIMVAIVAWLVPSSAQQPALAAMTSDAATSDSAVTVSETPTEIVLTPSGAGASVSDTGVFFQPGAKVDARAYAAVLRPLAEAGRLVVIPKQPFGIAFLSTGAFDAARSQYPEVTQWVVGGHSLGGTVAAMDAQAYAGAASEPVVGLLLFASYPATDMSGLDAQVLSISGSNDGLATPAKIDASKSSLPPDTDYVVVEGGVHAFFGDYGPQQGDGTPTITHDAARTQISAAAVAFVNGLSG